MGLVFLLPKNICEYVHTGIKNRGTIGPPRPTIPTLLNSPTTVQVCLKPMPPTHCGPRSSSPNTLWPKPKHNILGVGGVWVADAPRGEGVEEEVVVHHSALLVVLSQSLKIAKGGERNEERHGVNKTSYFVNHSTAVVNQSATNLENAIQLKYQAHSFVTKAWA